MKKTCLLVLGLWSGAAMAQAPQAAGGNDLVITLYNQLEALQQEVQTLRGIVEEQSYQIRRMQTEQRDRYLDIDQRLTEIAGGATGALPPPASVPGTTLPPAGIAGNSTSPAPSPAIDAGIAPVPPAGALPAPSPSTPATAGTVPPISPEVAQMDEQELYRTALNMLLEQSQYDESIRLFQSYIDTYPQGRFLTNAYYWQGEALILVARYNEARDVFLKIINDYPQDPKAAGAMLKLGVAYQQMGNADQAMQTWREIATRYPENATEIRAAQDYLNNR